MDDIENRIGELFTESLKGQFREVVTLEDVDQAIATMGTPDDIIDEDELPRTPSSKQAKKLYRNPDDKILGGVAGGMAAYWGISSLLIRICFVLLCCYYGIFIIVYIILWIAVPKAKTTKQKLEMKGESINVSNIERSIKDEYQEIKNGKGAAFMNRIGEGLCEGRSWSFKGTRYGETLELSQQDTLVLLVDERYKLPENLYIDQDILNR